jgi:hypothetical protein
MQTPTIPEEAIAKYSFIGSFHGPSKELERCRAQERKSGKWLHLDRNYKPAYPARFDCVSDYNKFEKEWKSCVQIGNDKSFQIYYIDLAGERCSKVQVVKESDKSLCVEINVFPN